MVWFVLLTFLFSLIFITDLSGILQNNAVQESLFNGYFGGCVLWFVGLYGDILNSVSNILFIPLG